MSVRIVKTTIVWLMDEMMISEEDLERELDMFQNANPVQILRTEHSNVDNKEEEEILKIMAIANL